MAIVLTLFLVVFGIFGQAIYGSPAYQKCSTEAGYESGKDYQWQEKDLPHAFVLLLKILGCAEHSIAENNPVVSAVATVVIAVFTIILGLFTICLSRSTRIAADAAKKSADALPTIERAYIFVVPTIISSTTMPKKGISYYFVNHGKTPAIVNGIERHFDPLTRPPDNSQFHANIPNHNEVVIAAGERYLPEQNGIYELIQVAPMKDAIAGEIPEIEFSWFYGTISYMDVFGTQRHTRFRWRYNRVTQEFCTCGAPPHNERT